MTQHDQGPLLRFERTERGDELARELALRVARGVRRYSSCDQLGPCRSRPQQVERAVDDDPVNQGPNGRRRSNPSIALTAASIASWATSSAAPASRTMSNAVRCAESQ